MRQRWDAANPGARAKITLAFRERRFGLPSGGYNELLDAQGGVCAICGEKLADRALAIDHDHSCCPDTRSSCGECVRGLLCLDCNTGIGKLKESAALLRAAADYLDTMNAVRP